MAQKRLKHAENDIFLEDVELDAGRDRGRQRDHHRKKKRRRWPFVLLILLLAVAGVLLYNHLRTGRNWTVAVFGVDSRDGQLESGTRSDVIMLVNVDRKTGDIKLCSVFRDTYLKVSEDGEYGKINKAYERGGHEQAVAALEENLDIQIDDYATFSWGTVATMINAVNGIDLEITDAEFRYINAFITETVEATGIPSVHLKSAGWNHLDGVQAVAYGRLRLMDTDFQRTARQRKVLSLALDKAKQADPLTLIAVVQSLMSEVSTSVDLGDIIPVINTLYKFNIPEDASSGFPFSRQTEDIGSQNYVIPTTLESNVIMLHQFLFGDEDYEAPQSVKDISARIASDSGLGEAGEAAPVPQVGGSSGEQAPATEAPETEALPETPSEMTEPAESEDESESESDVESEEETEAESESDPTEEGSEPASDDADPGEDTEERPAGRPTEPSEADETKPTQEEGRPVDRPTAPVEEQGPSGGPGAEGPGADPSPEQESQSVAESLSQLDKDAPVTQETAPGPGVGL